MSEIDPTKETREDRLIRQKYEQMLKQEERDKRRRERLAKLDDISKEPDQMMAAAAMGGIPSWNALNMVGGG